MWVHGSYRQAKVGISVQGEGIPTFVGMVASISLSFPHYTNQKK